MLKKKSENNGMEDIGLVQPHRKNDLFEYDIWDTGFINVPWPVSCYIDNPCLFFYLP